MEANSCAECMELDGQYFDEESVPDDPHENCRCILIEEEIEELE